VLLEIRIADVKSTSQLTTLHAYYIFLMSAV